LEDNIKMTL